MNHEYLTLLCDIHKNLLDDIAINYNSKKFIIYFEIFFMFYLLTVYVHKPKINNEEIKKIFLLWVNKTLNINKPIIIKSLVDNYNYLFRVFFIERNIYFHSSFNNVIKYFLPLPYKLNIYHSVITYRKGVSTFYKKDNSDYLYLKPNDFDLLNYKEDNLDIHIPIEYFDANVFKEDEIIYLVAKNDYLYICDKKQNILYTRINDFNNNYELNHDKYIYGMPLELILPIWIKNNDINKKLEFNEILYLCVLKKIKLKDLFNVYKKINITKDKYTYLYHNSFLTNNEIKSTSFLNKPIFFYPIPLTKSKYFKYEKKRNCVIFKIMNNIYDLLDLNNFIIFNNDFTKDEINKDRNKKLWISYDPLKTDQFFNKGIVPTKFDENFKCITTQNININDRIYCDKDFSGRRKLREILYKTRKYNARNIYYMESDKTKINESLEKYKIYHPPNFSVNMSWDFDKYILNDLNCAGFFSNDFGDALDGGEILLTKPIKYIKLLNIKNRPCYNNNSNNSS